MLAGAANVVVCCMDETMVPLFFWGRKGNVCHLSKEDQGHVLTENVSLAEKKASLSLIATVVNDAALQKHLAQILMPKGRKQQAPKDGFVSTWPATNMPAVPENVQVWKTTSGWMSGPLMMSYLKVLKQTIAKHRPGAHIVLALDCASCHLDKSLLNYARMHFGYMLFFPGQMGYIFDILDSKVFGPLKNDLHKDATALKMESETGRLSKSQWASVLYGTIEKHLTNADHSHEFPRHGLSADGTQLREPIKKFLNAGPLEAPRKLLESELHTLIGSNRQVYKYLFEGARYSRLQSPGPQAGASSSSAAAPSSSTRPIPVGAPLPSLKRFKSARSSS